MGPPLSHPTAVLLKQHGAVLDVDQITEVKIPRASSSPTTRSPPHYAMTDPQNFRHGLVGCFKDKGVLFDLNIDAGFC
jgi:hypothetical protein